MEESTDTACSIGLIQRRRLSCVFFNASFYEVAAAGCFEDEVTGEYTHIPEVATMRDGVVWGNKDAYHFEKYDMELSPEFRAYAIAHAPKA